MNELVAFIGLGEVGRTLGDTMQARGYDLRAYDLEFSNPNSVPSKNARDLGITPSLSASSAVKGASLIISAVTAEQTLKAAESALAGLTHESWYLDVNSASPQAKITAADLVNEAGGRYIEASIMSPIHPLGIAAPTLLGGPHANAFREKAQDFGFSGAKFYSDHPGKAAAAKLCRSVMIKGVEALVTEALLSARHYGVEDEVLTSLSNLIPHPDWQSHAAYMISRSAMHGKRRAEEMREASLAVSQTGIAPLMSTACAQRQDATAAFANAAGQADLSEMLDTIISLCNSEQLT